MALTKATKEVISNIDPSQINQAGATNGQVLTYSTDSNSWVSTNIYSNRNLIINGDMRIWQRGTSFTGIGAGTYTADRWTTTTSTASNNKNYSRQTLASNELPATEAGLGYYVRMRHTSGTDTAEIVLAQPIELAGTGFISPFVLNQEYTISFYARASTAGTASFNAQYRDKSDTTIHGINGISAPIPIPITTVWKKYSHTFILTVPPAPTSTSLMMAFSNNSIGANVDIDITGVQLEKGSIATPFEFRPYGMELNLCQRYFYKTTGEWPMAIRGFNGAEANNYVGVNVVFPNTMRTAPVMSGDTYNYGTNNGSGMYIDRAYIAAISNNTSNTCALTNALFNAEL